MQRVNDALWDKEVQFKNEFEKEQQTRADDIAELRGILESDVPHLQSLIEEQVGLRQQSDDKLVLGFQKVAKQLEADILASKQTRELSVAQLIEMFKDLLRKVQQEIFAESQ